MHIALTSTVVAPFDGIIKKAEDAVSIILIIFGSIDTPLCCNGVSATGRILKAECLYLIAQFGQ